MKPNHQFKEFKVSGTLLNGESVGDISFYYVKNKLPDLQKIINVDSIKSYSNYQIIQCIVVFYKRKELLFHQGFGYDILNNPIVEKRSKENFIQEQGINFIHFVNYHLASTQIRTKMGPAYEVLSYLKRNSGSMMSEAQVLKNRPITREMYRACLAPLKFLGYLTYDDNYAVKWTGKK